MKNLNPIKSFLLHSGCFLSLSIFSLSSFAHGGADHTHEEQPVVADVQEGFAYKKLNLVNGIDMIQGKGGNMLLIADDKSGVLIDNGYTENAEALKALVASQLKAPLKYVINTHWHGDHTGANVALGENSVIIAHQNVRKRLSTKQNIALFKMEMDALPEQGLPSITFEQEMHLALASEKLDIEYLAFGHTDSDSIIYLNNNNIVHMGDHYFAGMFPFVDVASGGDVERAAKNIGHVLTKINDETKVVPGHGALSNRAELVQYKAMLEGTVAEVKAMRQQKMNLKAMQAKGLSKKWDAWKTGFIDEATWILIINSSLNAAK